MNIFKLAFSNRLLRIGFIVILVSNLSITQAQEVYKLEIQFTGLVKNAESAVLIAVYNKVDNFLGDKPYTDFEAKTNGETNLTYTIDLPEGSYSMAFFQDLNGNKVLDKNLIGYPKEPFAFSNNAPANFGPPKWKDAVFKIDKPLKMIIDF